MDDNQSQDIKISGDYDPSQNYYDAEAEEAEQDQYTSDVRIEAEPMEITESSAKIDKR